MPDTRHRVAVQMDDETYERIRILAFQCRTTIPEIIRRCVDGHLDTIELAVVSEAKGIFRQFTQGTSPATPADLRTNKDAEPGPRIVEPKS